MRPKPQKQSAQPEGSQAEVCWSNYPAKRRVQYHAACCEMFPKFALGFIPVIKFIMGLYKRRFFQVAAVTLAIVFVCSLAVFYFENNEIEANIHSLWDGFWWAIVTAAAVGYGDRYPVSVAGRIIGILLIFSGVGLMSLLTATIASVFVERKIREEKGLENVTFKDHIVICGWNQHTEEVLQGLINAGSSEDISVALINELSIDEIDSLKMKYNKSTLKFLRGDYVYEDVLFRANIKKARFALLMADLSGSHSRDGIDERTALAALTIKSVAPQIKLIAELLDKANKPHLRRTNVDEIIVHGEHLGSLLVSAIISPGLPRVFSGIMSQGGTDKLRRKEIPKNYIGKPFKDLSGYFRERQAILIGVMRDKKDMKLEDLLSDNTSVIDGFIREKLKEANKSFHVEKSNNNTLINPDDSYIILPEDKAIVLAKKESSEFSVL
jgi:voltage-gated potassium channel